MHSRIVNFRTGFRGLSVWAMGFRCSSVCISVPIASIQAFRCTVMMSFYRSSDAVVMWTTPATVVDYSHLVQYALLNSTFSYLSNRFRICDDGTSVVFWTATLIIRKSSNSTPSPLLLRRALNRPNVSPAGVATLLVSFEIYWLRSSGALLIPISSALYSTSRRSIDARCLYMKDMKFRIFLLNSCTTASSQSHTSQKFQNPSIGELQCATTAASSCPFAFPSFNLYRIWSAAVLTTAQLYIAFPAKYMSGRRTRSYKDCSLGLSLTVTVAAGHTFPGTDATRKRNRPVFDEAIGEYTVQEYHKVIKLVEEKFVVFSTIDVHNRYRQGNLELEGEWHTQRWQLRLFAIVLGMILTNSYFACRHVCLHHLIEQIDDYQFSSNSISRIVPQKVFGIHCWNTSKAWKHPASEPVDNERTFQRFHLHYSENVVVFQLLNYVWARKTSTLLTILILPFSLTLCFLASGSPSMTARARCQTRERCHEHYRQTDLGRLDKRLFARPMSLFFIQSIVARSPRAMFASLSSLEPSFFWGP